MNTITLTSQHSQSFATLRLQGTRARSFGWLVKYSLKTGLEDDTKEVSG